MAISVLRYILNMPFEIGFWNTGSLDTQGLQKKLHDYTSVRKKFNDPSMTALTTLVNSLIANMNDLQRQVNTGSIYVNNHKAIWKWD